MLTESDRERMDNLMENVLEVRSQREEPVVRNETRINEILRSAEARANAEHQLLLESRNTYAGYIGNGVAQTPVRQSENLKKFPKLSDWKRRFTAS